MGISPRPPRFLAARHSLGLTLVRCGTEAPWIGGAQLMLCLHVCERERAFSPSGPFALCALLCVLGVAVLGLRFWLPLRNLLRRWPVLELPGSLAVVWCEACD